MNPDNVLARYEEWQDVSQWPTSADEDKFSYSHHATDMVSGRLCNAFDLVRLQKFGQRDEVAAEGTPVGKLPSFLAMLEFAAQDPVVKRQVIEERRAQAQMEFADADWQEHLDINSKGIVLKTLNNLILILENNPMLKSIVFNQLSDGMEIKGDVPWKHPSKWWRDADDAQLISYVDRTYGVFSRSYHPIREYLMSLPDWDGVVRLDTLLIDYLGAKDIDYVRAVTSKVFTAAVARVFEPGIKFDWMLVLNGSGGIGKSTLINKLGGQWFSDSLQLSDTHDKTGAE